MAPISDEDDDLQLPAMDSETARVLRYATTLHWNDPAYVLGCFVWNCSQDAFALARTTDSPPEVVEAAERRRAELQLLWRNWMQRDSELYAKRAARWSQSDELPLGTRLAVRLEFLSAELKTIAGEVEYTAALAAHEQRFAIDEVSMLRERVETMLTWIGERRGRIDTADASADTEDTVQ